MRNQDKKIFNEEDTYKYDSMLMEQFIKMKKHPMNFMSTFPYLSLISKYTCNCLYDDVQF